MKKKNSMEKKYRLEPFDLERAKAGEPVCTKNGEDVRILCFERNNDKYPIVALKGHDDAMMCYTRDGKHAFWAEDSGSDLMMKVEVKEPYIYAEVAGDIRPFDEVKSEGFVDLGSLDYLIIKMHDGSFLRIWKKNLPRQEWGEAQKSAPQVGEGWRCPTRHECIDIYDAKFKGLDDAMKEIGGKPLKETYWTSEADPDPQYHASGAVYFDGGTGRLSVVGKFDECSVRPVLAFSIDSDPESE